MLVNHHPHISFPAPVFSPYPHLVACHIWAPCLVCVHLALMKTRGLGSKRLIDSNISPPRDQLELFPETIELPL